MNTRAQRQVKVDAQTTGRHAVVLGGSLEGLAHRFQKRFAKVNEAPWLMATGEDFRYRETVGGSAGRVTRFMHRYMDHVIRLSTRSVEVRTVLMRAFNLLVPPTALFRPRVLFRVLINMFKSATKREGRSLRKQVWISERSVPPAVAGGSS